MYRVTETDRSNEALIHRGLMDAFPSDCFLGEVSYLPAVPKLVRLVVETHDWIHPEYG